MHARGTNAGMLSCSALVIEVPANSAAEQNSMAIVRIGRVVLPSSAMMSCAPSALTSIRTYTCCAMCGMGSEYG